MIQRILLTVVALLQTHQVVFAQTTKHTNTSSQEFIISGSGFNDEDREAIRKILEEAKALVTVHFSSADSALREYIAKSAEAKRGVFANCTISIGPIISRSAHERDESLQILRMNFRGADEAEVVTGGKSSGYGFTFKKADKTWRIIKCYRWME